MLAWLYAAYGELPAVAVMVALLLVIGRDSLLDWRAWLIAGISLWLTFGWKRANAMWTVGVGALLGYVLQLI